MADDGSDQPNHNQLLIERTTQLTVRLSTGEARGVTVGRCVIITLLI